MPEIDTVHAAFGDIMLLRAMKGLNTTAEQVLTYRKAADAGTVEIIRSHLEEPVGYIVWVHAVKEGALRFLQSGTLPIYGYEWNEGRICILVDVLSNGQRHQFTARLRAFFRRRRALAFMRRQKSYACLRHVHKRRTRVYGDFSTTPQQGVA